MLAASIADDCTEGELEAALKDVKRMAEAGPPLLGTPDATKALETLDGRAFFLGLALDGGQLQLSHEALLVLASIATPMEYAAVRWSFYGISAGEAADALLGSEPGEGENLSETWLQSIAGLASEYGWTFDQIYDMTIREYHAARLYSPSRRLARSARRHGGGSTDDDAG